MNYQILREGQGYVLVGNSKGQRTVVGMHGNQVTSAMPGDLPDGGGLWYASNTDAGINYVANFYSRSYANRIFRKLTQDGSLLPW